MNYWKPADRMDNEMTSHVMIDNSDVLAALALIQREYPTAKASFEISEVHGAEVTLRDHGRIALGSAKTFVAAARNALEQLSAPSSAPKS